MIQNLSRELFSVADEHGGKLQTVLFSIATSLARCRLLIFCRCFLPAEAAS